MGRNSRMMIHDASSMVYGNEADMLATAEWLSEESDNIADIYSQKAGGKPSDWRGLMRAETWYSSSEAVKAGLADEVQSSSKEATDSADLVLVARAEEPEASDWFSSFDPEDFKRVFNKETL